MAFNIFRKKEKHAEPVKKPAETRQDVPTSGGKQAGKVSWGGMSGAVLRNLHMSEKASYKAEENQYIFKVASNATKHAVKNAVQEAFGVIATKVNMVTIHSKTKRTGKGFGVKQGYKKAIVKVKEGQKIEVLAR